MKRTSHAGRHGQRGSSADRRCGCPRASGRRALRRYKRWPPLGSLVATVAAVVRAAWLLSLGRVVAIARVKATWRRQARWKIALGTASGINADAGGGAITKSAPSPSTMDALSIASSRAALRLRRRADRQGRASALTICPASWWPPSWRLCHASICVATWRVCAGDGAQSSTTRRPSGNRCAQVPPRARPFSKGR